MKLRDVLLAAATALAVAPAAGCYGTTGYVAYSPPRARVETVAVRPGYVWVHGHWVWGGNQWRWQGGYYQPVRTGFVWIQGHWSNTDEGYVWIDGHWARPDEITVREHRY